MVTSPFPMFLLEPLSAGEVRLAGLEHAFGGAYPLIVEQTLLRSDGRFLVLR